MIGREDFSRDKLEEHLQVVSGVYENEPVTNADFIAWKHCDSPFGPSTSLSLRDKKTGKLIGRSFLQPRPFVLERDLYLDGATVTDLVIEKDSRNAARFIALAKAVAEGNDFSIIAHSSNEVSDIFYRKMFKYPVEYTMQAVGLPLRSYDLLMSMGMPKFLAVCSEVGAFLWRLLLMFITVIVGLVSRIRLSQFGSATQSSLNDIYEAQREWIGPHFLRNSEFEQWRYKDCPLTKCQTLLVQFKKEVIGHIILQETTFNGVKFLLIQDGIFSRPLSTLEFFVIKFYILRAGVALKADVVFGLFNLNNIALKRWKDFPFFTVPDRVLPHPTPIFVHTKNNDYHGPKHSEMYMTLGDLDYF